jgi:hypothetical protein
MGGVWAWQVTFRPMVEEVYEDSIEFRVKDGVFHVPIKAVLPYADISVRGTSPAAQTLPHLPSPAKPPACAHLATTILPATR